MSKPTAAVKNKWNDKSYDRINLTVPKGNKEKIKEYAKKNGESVNGMINRLLDEVIRK